MNRAARAAEDAKEPFDLETELENIVGIEAVKVTVIKIYLRS